MKNFDADKWFWKYVDKRSDNECWEWVGYKTHKGYGQISRWAGIPRSNAHRVSYKIHFGEIGEKILVCHKCDNRKCVNPEHLFLGTPKENMHDKINKNRSASTGRLLNKNIVLDIRNLRENGVKYKELAERYNVSQNTIYDICKVNTWKNL